MVVKDITRESRTNEAIQNSQEIASEIGKLDCIYNNELLRSEKYLVTLTKRMQVRDLLEEVDLEYVKTNGPTYITVKLDPSLKTQVTKFQKEFQDCFTWLGLSRDLV